MERFTVTKVIEFDAGHRVPNHKSACHNVHGHRYKLEVIVSGPLVKSRGTSDEGMVVDFGDIKKAAMEEVHARFDHCFIAYGLDPMRLRWDDWKFYTSIPDVAPKDECGNPVLGMRVLVKDFGIVQFVPAIPTAENLARICYLLLQPRIFPPMKLEKVRLWETPSSVAEYEPNL